MRDKKRLLIYSLCLVFCMVMCCSCKGENAYPNLSEDDVLVIVNDEPILHSEIDFVYEQYKETNISYDDIVEDSILEILAIQQADNFGIVVTEEDIDDSILLLQSQYPEVYKEAIKTHTNEQLREKLRDRRLYVRVEDYARENIITITHDDITSFLKDKHLEKELAGYSDDFIKEYLDEELDFYMIQKWLNSLKINADIQYINWKPQN